jgi:putative endonuclease
MNTRKAAGKLGEEKAVSFLKSNNYRIICRNYYTKYGEIDIIARDGDELVFVEVKLRASGLYGGPEAAVDIFKQHKIIKSAMHYMHSRNIDDTGVRFDAVFINESSNKIELIKSAFILDG